jgi:hypothetical protein
MARLSLVATLVSTSAVIAIVTACSVEVDLSGKGCPCPDGLVCDTRLDTCVTSLLPTGRDDAGPPAAACNDAECACKTNDDCIDPKRRYCGPASTCVECLGGAADTCTAGGYCNDKNQCVVGCKGDADCQLTGQRCNTTTHRCVDCVGDGDCAEAGASSKCSPSGTCAETCSGEGTPCGTGGTCCSGFCLALAADVLNCGQCGKACSTTNNTPTCTAGQCSFKCADGYDHCGPPGDNSGCETNIRNAANCGSCGVACSAQTIVFANAIACTGNACTYATCQQGHLDDDKDAANGCEVTCGGKLERCCPAPQTACNSGADCKTNGSCPNQ